MKRTQFQTNADALARYLARIGTGTQILATTVILGGPLIAADGIYPVLSSSLPTILASGALLFAASSYFRVKALEARLDARDP